MTATQEIGRDRRRKEDQRLITGRTRWTDNITLPGMLHLAMVRSPFAHATITGIDVEEARQARNVVAVLTGADLAELQGVCINAWPITPDQKAPAHLPMPTDRVAFAGEVVAVVVAAARPRRGTLPSSSTSTTTSSRRRSTSRRPPPTRSSRTPTSRPTRARSGSSTPPRRAPGATSTRPSRRPAGTASSSSGSTASSG